MLLGGTGSNGEELGGAGGAALVPPTPYWATLLHTGLYWFILVCTGLYWSELEHTRVTWWPMSYHWRGLGGTGRQWGGYWLLLLLHSDSYWAILVYTGLYWETPRTRSAGAG